MRKNHRKKHFNTIFRALKVAIALLMSFSLPSFAASDPIQDVYNICTHKNIFMNFRVSAFENAGWTQRKGGFSQTELQNFSQIMAAINPAVIKSPLKFKDQFALEIKQLQKIESFPDDFLGRTRILEKEQDAKATLLIVDRGQNLQCIVTQKALYNEGSFIKAFTHINKPQLTAVAKTVWGVSQWEPYNKTYHAQTEILVVEPNFEEIINTLGPNTNRVIGLLMSTEIKKVK